MGISGGLSRIIRLIDDERVSQGLSGRDLAARAGLGAGSVSRILKQQVAPGLDTLAALAEALGYSLEAFLAVALGVSRRQKETEELAGLFESLPQEDQEVILMLARYCKKRHSSSAQP